MIDSFLDVLKPLILVAILLYPLLLIILNVLSSYEPCGKEIDSIGCLMIFSKICLLDCTSIFCFSELNFTFYHFSPYVKNELK
mgnify:CR=1 FL=1